MRQAFGGRIIPGAMDALIAASYAPGVTLHPGHLGDPHRAVLRDPSQQPKHCLHCGTTILFFEGKWDHTKTKVWDHEAAPEWPIEGKLVGVCRQCFACGEWINMFHEDAKSGAENIDLGFWKCKPCFIQQRKLTIAPTKGNITVDVAIPDEFAAASVLDFTLKIRKRVHEWPVKVKFLVINGPSRSGKTHMTWAIVKEQARAGHNTMRILASTAQKAWQGAEHNHQREQIERLWREAHYLIIDNFDLCDATGPWIRVVQSLIDMRLREGQRKPTIITTAVGASTLGTLYGEAILNRLTAPSTEWLRLEPHNTTPLLEE